VSNSTRLLPGSPLYFCSIRCLQMPDLPISALECLSVIRLAILIFYALRFFCRCTEDLLGKGRGPGKDIREPESVLSGISLKYILLR